MPITLASAQAQDARDALAPLRQEFNLPDGVIYLDGNSLGAQPKAALARAQQVIQQEWGVGLIRSWNTAGWFELPQRLGNQLGKLVGAKDGEVVVTVCALLDVALMAAGVFGLGALVQSSPRALTVIAWAGAAVLAVYGLQALTRALAPGQLVAAHSGASAPRPSPTWKKLTPLLPASSPATRASLTSRASSS